MFWGQHEGAWIAFYLYPELYLDVSYDPAFSEQLHLWEEVARSACWWWPHEGLCVISERPTVVEMEPVRPGTQEYRLHADNGPALVFADGWSVWSWHGVMVPEAVITKPESLAATEIRDERNAEVRRVMLERFGTQRYIEDIGAEKVHADEFGTLWRAEFSDDEALVMVEVVNSTPEPDGTFKNYWLRVPPNIRTAQGAIAWTFGLPKDQYQPSVMS